MFLKKLLHVFLFMLLRISCDGQYNVTITVHDHSPILREQIYISGNFNNWDSLANPQWLMKQENKGTHTITLNLPPGPIEMKFTGGNWKSVVKHDSGSEPSNWNAIIKADTIIEVDVYQWRDLMIPANRMLLRTSTEDTIRLKALTVLAIAYSGDPMFYDVDSSSYYFQSVFQFIDQHKQGSPLRAWKNYRSWTNMTLFTYAGWLRSHGNYHKALEIWFSVFKDAEELKDTLDMCNMLNQITSEYLQAKDYSSALANALRSKELLDAAQPENTGYKNYLLFNSLMGLGRSYYYLNDLNKSLQMANQANKLTSIIFHEYSKAIVSQLLGDIYLARHHLDSAQYYFTDAIQVAREKTIINTLVSAYKGMALTFREQGLIDSAFYYARNSLGVIRNNSDLFHASGEYAENYIAAITPILADLHKRKNNADSAYYYLSLSVAMKDSINSIEKLREFQNLRLNEGLRQEQQKQQLVAERQKASARLKTYGFIAGILILGIFGLFQVRTNRQKQATNAVLESQKKDLENTLDVLQQTQNQLIQAEKMASLGELTAGIAHEIKNPLNFVNNFSEVNTELIDELQDELAKGNVQAAKEVALNIKENEVKIQSHGKRADAIVKGMLQHSRNSSGQKELTDINALCDEYLRLAYHGLRAKDKSFNATIQTDFDPGVGAIQIMPQEIGRVILNLITNAFYAVNEKKSHLMNSPNPQHTPYNPTVIVQTKKLTDHKFVEITIADNGPGIPPSIMEKIFQPFFTTKPTGQGTGLGLSLSYDIVKSHGGELKVESKEGEGASFTIKLPLA